VPALYGAALLGVTALVVGVLWRFGTRPSAREVVLAGLGAFCVTIVFIACTLILHAEGNSSRLPLFFLAGTWAFFAGPRPAVRGCGPAVCLFVVLFMLWLQHLALATSPEWTDNPDARIRSWVIADRRAQGEGRPAPPPIRVSPTSHTLYTGLYRVEPPFGGSLR
jgi:hypothetical protein